MQQDRRLCENEEERQRREHFIRNERQSLEDMAAVLRRPEGVRVLREILGMLGIGHGIGAEDLALFNFGLLLVGRMGRANPDKTARILAALHGIGAEK